MERSCRSDSLGPCTYPWLRVSPSFRLLREITKSCVSTMFRGVYPNVRRHLCRRNLKSVTCQNVPGPPPAFPIVWEVVPGKEAAIICSARSFHVCTEDDFSLLSSTSLPMSATRCMYIYMYIARYTYPQRVPRADSTRVCTLRVAVRIVHESYHVISSISCSYYACALWLTYVFLLMIIINPINSNSYCYI